MQIKDKPILNIDITDYRFLFVKSFNNAGGVGIHLRKNLNYTLTEKYNLPLPTCENMWLKYIQGWEKTIVIDIIDCDILHFLFIECTGAFTFLNDYTGQHNFWCQDGWSGFGLI